LITDTVFIEYNGDINIIDFSNKRQCFLGFDRRAKNFIEITKQGEVELVLKDLSNDGPNGFGSEMWGASYFNDTTLLVLGTKSFFIYGLNGELIEKREHPFRSGLWYNSRKRLYPIQHRDSTYIVGIMGDGTVLPPNNQVYYQQAYAITVTNFEMNDFDFIGSFNETHTYGKENYYLNLERLLDVSDDHKLVFVGFELEPRVYVYDFSSSNLIRIINLYPQYFKKPIGFKWGQQPAPDDILRAMTTNSVFHKIFVRENVLLIEYYSGIDTSDVTLDEYNNQQYKNNKKYLHIVTDSTVSNDLEIPAYFRTLNWVDSLSELWFSCEDGFFENESEKEIFFICTLISK
jgi:DNA-binding beta-propeller fold protein YncE